MTEKTKTTKEEVKKEPNTKEILLKSLFILLIFAVILILAFAVIRFLPKVVSSLASVGGLLKSPFEKGLVLKANETKLNSGETFRLNFQYEPKEEGNYDLIYGCAPNLTIFVADPNNTKLDCNKNYRIPATDNFIDLKVVLDKENFYTETEIKVAYVNRVREKISDDAIKISVVNQAGVPVSDLSGSATISSQSAPTSQTPTPTPTPTQTPTTRTTQTVIQTTPAPTYYVSPTLPDLTISNARALNNTTVVFDVSNIGGQPTGTWYFNYTIPGERIESSPRQISLNPGDTIRYTLSFANIASGNTMIMLDPQNLIRENSETNNTATIYLRGDGGSSSRSRDYDDYDRYDLADLKIEDLEVGRMRGSRFVVANEISEGDIAAVQFEVKNIGGKNTGTWRFEIENTPYDRSDVYRSSRQNSLRPGESKILTVEFKNPDEGHYRIRVVLDPDDDVKEERENNNTSTATLRVVR